MKKVQFFGENGKRDREKYVEFLCSLLSSPIQRIRDDAETWRGYEQYGEMLCQRGYAHDCQYLRVGNHHGEEGAGAVKSESRHECGCG